MKIRIYELFGLILFTVGAIIGKEYNQIVIGGIIGGVMGVVLTYLLFGSAFWMSCPHCKKIILITKKKSKANASPQN